VSVGDHIEIGGSYCRSRFASTCVLVGCIQSNLKQAVRFRTCICYIAGLNRGRAIYYSEGVFAPLKTVLALTVGHGSPNVLWQQATPVTLGWFAGST